MEATTAPIIARHNVNPAMAAVLVKCCMLEACIDDPASRHSNKLAPLLGELLSNIDLFQSSFP
jgi:hypothetical protein